MPSPYPRGTASKRTKLVCTLGPAVTDRVEALVRIGMDVARVNFSHGTDDERVRATEEVRRAGEAVGRPIGLLADLPGPKLRLGSVDPDPVTLRTGATFVLRPSGRGSAGGAAVTHPELASDVHPGDRILLADGAAELRVEEARGGEVVCEVVRGGEIRSHTGVNVPSERLSLPALTDQDRRDLGRADELDFDMVAQSFVRTGDDVRELRERAGDLIVMAKVETHAATRNFDDICAAADAVMIARGDLGVEVPYEEVPALQKQLTSRANALGVPVVVATQMLESMVEAPRPTRAEATDVANAVWDGTDAVMLSAETAIGSHPVEAAGAAVRIVRSAETGGPGPLPRDRTAVDSEPESIARAACALADEDRRIAAIACFTRTGRTAALLAATRPRVPVFAFSPGAEVVRRLTLLRGVHPATCTLPPNTDEMIAEMDRDLRRVAEVPEDTPVVMVASTPVGIAHTNLLKIHRIGRP